MRFFSRHVVLNCVAPLGMVSNQVLNFVARFCWCVVHGESARRQRVRALLGARQKMNAAQGV